MACELTEVRSTAPSTVTPMGIFFRRTKRIGNTRVTASSSGLTASRRFGPFTVSTRGNLTIRLAKGLSFRKKLF